MKEEDAKKLVELGPGSLFEQMINFMNAKHYLEAIEKADPLAEALGSGEEIVFEGSRHYAIPCSIVEDALAKYQEER